MIDGVSGARSSRDHLSCRSSVTPRLPYLVFKLAHNDDLTGIKR